jgi:hypothetical protein
MGYDTRRRSSTDYVVKGYRTVTASSATNLGNISVGNNYTSSLNGNASLTIRRQLRSNLASKFFVQGLYDQSTTEGNSSAGEQFVVKEIYTLSNAITNFSTSSN